jgi:hypothetical protein
MKVKYQGHYIQVENKVKCQGHYIQVENIIPQKIGHETLSTI